MTEASALPKASDIWTTSPQTDKIFAAYVKFQADVGNAEKNKTNPHFKSRYADLESAIEAAKPHLAKHDLAVMQHPYSVDSLVGVCSTLIHVSGQWISSTLLLAPSRNDPQGSGSAITYARRYSYLAILGMATEDDDGNAATQPKDPENDSPEVVAKKKHYVSPAQLGKLASAMKAKGISADKMRELVAKHWKIESAQHLTQEQFHDLWAMIEQGDIK